MTDSSKILGPEHELVAAALEAAADAQEAGRVGTVGDLYDPTLVRVLEVNDRYDSAIAFAVTFWDNWIDASNHEWLYHEPITEADWPRYAREVARSVRNGTLPDNPDLVEHTLVPPRQPLMERLKALLFGPR